MRNMEGMQTEEKTMEKSQFPL